MLNSLKPSPLLVGEVKLDNYQFDENIKGAAIGTISTEGIATSGIEYSLSGEDARFFEITSEGVLKLKQDFQADHERDNEYKVTITANNDSGESLTTVLSLSVNDVSEAMEAAQLIFGKNTVFSYDSIWLKDSNNNWFESNSYAIHIEVAEKESDQEVYLFSINLIDDQNGSYNLMVKSPSGFDVSDNFRFDADTGAVYLKAGNALDFETSTGHYHAGTDALSYGVYGPDYSVSDSVRPLIFSLEDEFGKVNLTYTENFSLYNPVYIVLDYGDTADDGTLEVGHTLPNGELDLTNNGLGQIVASAGGKDITGDGYYGFSYSHQQ